MLPENTVMFYDNGRKFLLDKSDEPLIDFEFGGIAIGDTSEGLLYQIWKLVYSANNFRVYDQNNVSVLVHTVSGLVTECSLAFDQNMRPSIAYVEDGVTKLYWFDSISSSNVISEFPTFRSPKISLDDGRNFNVSNSDIVFAYIEGTDLKYRIQRERFETEHLIVSDIRETEVIEQIGMDKGFRFKFELEFIDE